MIVLVSANYGQYEAPKVQPNLGVRQIMFTDDLYLDAPGWEVRHEPLVNVASPMMRAKLWKCRPDLAAPEAEVVVWIDGSMTVKRPDMIDELVERLGDSDALFMRHPWRRCIYAEEVASRPAPKYRGQPMAEQVEHYRTHGHPAEWGLVATGMIVWRNTPRTAQLGAAWFDECQRWSYQDQLSLPPLLRTMPLRMGWMEDPWETWWTLGTH